MSRLLRKKDSYTTITPLPAHIPRALAITLLHSHSEVITVNPLILSHNAIPAPRDAPADEYYATWYNMVEQIQYIPGVGKLGSGTISFKGCFHDVPWGLQTHVYAPMNIDLRHKYRIGGNEPGETPEPFELGSEAPREGLYLREDIEIRCNVTLMSFVRAQLKAASKEMVERIIRKAELLDSGVLRGLFDAQGKLTTVNPNDRSTDFSARLSPPHSASPLPSPGIQSLYYPSSPRPELSPTPASPKPTAHIAEMPGDYEFFTPPMTPARVHPTKTEEPPSELPTTTEQERVELPTSHTQTTTPCSAKESSPPSQPHTIPHDVPASLAIHPPPDKATPTPETPTGEKKRWRMSLRMGKGRTEKKTEPGACVGSH